MIIRFFSDLHLDVWPAPKTLKSVGEELIVIAGNVGVGLSGIKWAVETLTWCPVLYVAGNREFFGADFDEQIGLMKLASTGSNVVVLENDANVHDGVRFLGATMWTDFEAFGGSNRSESLELARIYLSDFSRISRRQNGRSRPLLPIETRDRHLESRKWLEREIAASTEPTIVITHHAPCLDNLMLRSNGDMCGAHCSDLCQLMKPNVRAWISGHTHLWLEREINETYVVSNQRGYPRDNLLDFDWARCIDV